jgi:hypothetical protein
VQSFSRVSCRALVEPRIELRAEPCAEPRIDVQTCRRADVQSFVLAINCRDICRDDCIGNCMGVWLIVRIGVRVGN